MNRRHLILGVVLAATVLLAFWPQPDDQVEVVGVAARQDGASRANPEAGRETEKTMTTGGHARFPVLKRDLFPAQTWRRPVAAVKKPESVAPPPPPAPPEFPFTYSGRWASGGKEVVFLGREDDLTRVASGEVVAGQWRLDKIEPHGLMFTYLPLNMTKTLRITR